MEEYAYRLQLLMSVNIKMKAFELTRKINKVFPVMEFESEGGVKYASNTMLNDVKVPNAAQQVQVRGKSIKSLSLWLNCANFSKNKVYTC